MREDTSFKFQAGYTSTRAFLSPGCRVRVMATTGIGKFYPEGICVIVCRNKNGTYNLKYIVGNELRKDVHIDDMSFNHAYITSFAAKQITELHRSKFTKEGMERKKYQHTLDSIIPKNSTRKTNAAEAIMLALFDLQEQLSRRQHKERTLAHKYLNELTTAHTNETKILLETIKDVHWSKKRKRELERACQVQNLVKVADPEFRLKKKQKTLPLASASLNSASNTSPQSRSGCKPAVEATRNEEIMKICKAYYDTKFSGYGKKTEWIKEKVAELVAKGFWKARDTEQNTMKSFLNNVIYSFKSGKTSFSEKRGRRFILTDKDLAEIRLHIRNHKRDSGQGEFANTIRAKLTTKYRHKTGNMPSTEWIDAQMRILLSNTIIISKSDSAANAARRHLATACMRNAASNAAMVYCAIHGPSEHCSAEEAAKSPVMDALISNYDETTIKITTQNAGINTEVIVDFEDRHEQIKGGSAQGGNVPAMYVPLHSVVTKDCDENGCVIVELRLKDNDLDPLKWGPDKHVAWIQTPWGNRIGGRRKLCILATNTKKKKIIVKSVMQEILKNIQSIRGQLSCETAARIDTKLRAVLLCDGATEQMSAILDLEDDLKREMVSVGKYASSTTSVAQVNDVMSCFRLLKQQLRSWNKRVQDFIRYKNEEEISGGTVTETMHPDFGLDEHAAIKSFDAQCSELGIRLKQHQKKMFRTFLYRFVMGCYDRSFTPKSKLEGWRKPGYCEQTFQRSFQVAMERARGFQKLTKEEQKVILEEYPTSILEHFMKHGELLDEWMDANVQLLTDNYQGTKRKSDSALTRQRAILPFHPKYQKKRDEEQQTHENEYIEKGIEGERIVKEFYLKNLRPLQGSALRPGEDEYIRRLNVKKERYQTWRVDWFRLQDKEGDPTIPSSTRAKNISKKPCLSRALAYLDVEKAKTFAKKNPTVAHYIDAVEALLQEYK